MSYTIAIVLFFGLAVAALIYEREWIEEYYTALSNSSYDVGVLGSNIYFTDKGGNGNGFRLKKTPLGYKFYGWPSHLSFIKKSALKSAALKVARISMENDLTAS